MKKVYSTPEFLKIYMVEDVLDISGDDNLGNDITDDDFDAESATDVSGINLLAD